MPAYAILTVLGLTFLYSDEEALAQEEPPHFIYGHFWYHGCDVPEGTLVTIASGDVALGRYLIQKGSTFYMEVPRPAYDKGGEKPLDIFVGDWKAWEFKWESGKKDKLYANIEALPRDKWYANTGTWETITAGCVPDAPDVPPLDRSPEGPLLLGLQGPAGPRGPGRIRDPEPRPPPQTCAPMCPSRCIDTRMESPVPSSVPVDTECPRETYVRYRSPSRYLGWIVGTGVAGLAVGAALTTSIFLAWNRFRHRK